jgi:hypothetical protein
MWWPSPDLLDDLSLTEAEEGWLLSAPNDTELAEWLNYWNQDEEHQKFFNEAFVALLLNHLDRIEDKHGENEVLPDGSQSDREQAQDVSTGSLT